MKKIFIISAILLGILLVFLGIYNFAFKRENISNSQIPNDSAKKNDLLIKSEKIIPISDIPVIGSVFDSKTEEIKYYDASTGIVWKTDASGKGKQQITNDKVAGLKSVHWSSDYSKVISSMTKEGKTSFYMYDYKAQKGTLLKSNSDTVVWDNLGTKIFYKYFDSSTNKRSLNIANPDGSGWQKIIDVSDRSLDIAQIPSTALVSYWNTANANEETNLRIISITGGDSKTILSGQFGASYLWSLDGSKALVSSLLNRESKMTTVGIVTIEGKYQDLKIPTITSKCVWSKDNISIYCALPGAIPSDAVMPNDYQENKFNTEDTFWKIDIVTGEKKRVVETADIKNKYDSSNMMLSATEDALYFTNKIDKRLYKIEL